MIRLASIKDLDQIWDLREQTKELLKSRNIDQWQYNNPSIEQFINDIKLNEFYIYEIDQTIVGMISIKSGIEKTYHKIYDGTWSLDQPYYTIHRLAINKNFLGKNISKNLLDFAESIAIKNNIHYIRIDTHRNNKYAIKLFTNHGYTLKGYIFLEQDQGDLERLAFDKIL